MLSKTVYSLLNLTISLLIYNSSFGQFSSPSFEMSFLEDAESIHSFESIKLANFQQLPNHVVNLGVTKSTIWVKLKLDTESLLPQAILEVKNSYFDTITVSYLEKNNEVYESLGIAFPHSKNKLNHYLPAFEIPTSNLSSPYVYLKIQGRWSMVVHITVKTKENFNNDRISTYLIAGLLIGGLLLMGLYNLFLYFSTRDFSYILYVIALLGAILSQGYIFGILIPYISPESPEFSLRFPIVIMAVTGLFCCWFTIRFLEIKKTSTRFYKLLIFGIIFSLFSILLEVLKFDDLSRKVNIFEVIGLSTIIFSSAVYSLVKGNKIAIYFTIAWSVYLAGMVVFALKTVDILPHNEFTKHFMHIGTFMEVILLSFALGHKYSLVRIEKERLEQQTREELEKLVKFQTTELEASLKEKEILLKEIHHRVKNNLQIIISLLDLQLASIKGSKNKEIFAQSKSRVYSMSLIHQKLYQTDNLAQINMKNYLEELFAFVHQSFQDTVHNVTPILHIDKEELSVHKAVPLGLIVNELLTNSFKHSIRNTTSNFIKLSLTFHESHLILSVADSGPGFEEKEHKENIKKSLGLFLIKSLTKQLKGTIQRKSENELFITKLTIPLELPENEK